MQPHGGYSSAGRALGCGPGGRGFKPRYSPQCEGPDSPGKYWEVGALLVGQEPVLGTFWAHFVSSTTRFNRSATASRSSSKRSAYWSKVSAALVCPSIRWMTFTFAPAETASEAAVCRRSWGVTRGKCSSLAWQRLTAPENQPVVFCSGLICLADGDGHTRASGSVSGTSFMISAGMGTSRRSPLFDAVISAVGLPQRRGVPLVRR